MLQKASAAFIEELVVFCVPQSKARQPTWKRIGNHQRTCLWFKGINVSSNLFEKHYFEVLDTFLFCDTNLLSTEVYAKAYFDGSHNHYSHSNHTTL